MKAFHIFSKIIFSHFYLILKFQDQIILHAAAVGNFALFNQNGSYLSNSLVNFLTRSDTKYLSFDQICKLVKSEISSLKPTRVSLADREVSLVQMPEVTSCLTKELYFFSKLEIEKAKQEEATIEKTENKVFTLTLQDTISPHLIERAFVFSKEVLYDALVLSSNVVQNETFTDSQFEQLWP